MVRYAILVAIVIGSAATAIAAVEPVDPAAPHNLTIVAKNQAFPLVGPLVVESCATEDCSDTN